MQFRYARHTQDIEPLTAFYTNIIGLEVLGDFKAHAGYDGILLGYKNADWHFEFTTNGAEVNHHFDDDDLLVFYFETQAEIKNVLRKANKNNVAAVTARNPYWVANGYTLTDPDGCRITIALRSPLLSATDELTQSVLDIGINDWSSLAEYIQQLPYGRNQNRHDLSLVMKEGKGTCSSKHALLKRIGALNGIRNVQLIIGIYKMTQSNTPKIGNELIRHHIDYIPEAHCYLKLNGQRIDLTSPNAAFELIEKDLLAELEIEPEQVADFKIAYHKDYLKEWIPTANLPFSFDELWAIREQCIVNLSA